MEILHKCISLVCAYQETGGLAWAGQEPKRIPSCPGYPGGLVRSIFGGELLFKKRLIAVVSNKLCLSSPFWLAEALSHLRLCQEKKQTRKTGVMFVLNPFTVRWDRDRDVI